jgi:hypothetical protein
MGFSQATIVEVFPPRIKLGQAFLSWSSTSPPGTHFQVYANQVLSWFGRATSAWVPIPSGPVRIDIGTVLPGEEQTSFAGSLTASPSRRAKLQWKGGSYLGSDIAGFHVYGEATPGGGVNYAKILGTITAYPAGILTDGYGLGGYGQGGYGQSPGTYTWESNPLSSGTWTFGIKPFDKAGNEGTASTTTVSICAPPREPAVFADGISRLKYTLTNVSGVGYGSGGYGDGAYPGEYATLMWRASPG